MEIDRALRRLREADRAIDEVAEEPRSLAPGRPRPTALEALGGRLLTNAAPDVMRVFTDALHGLALAQAQHFPDTIFWDFDFLAARLFATASDDLEAAESLATEMIELQAQFGRHSILCFRYTHDFTYGYDWAKWVAKAPAERARYGPFSPTFVHYLRHRGRELVDLIADDDEKYPKLPNGRPRNPFGFSRTPENEARLLGSLADDDLIPVKTWQLQATPTADRPFARLREQRAVQLGIPARSGDSGSNDE